MSLEMMIKENNMHYDQLQSYHEQIKKMAEEDLDDSEEYYALVDKWADTENLLVRSKATLYKRLLEESFKPSADKKWVEGIYKLIK